MAELEGRPPLKISILAGQIILVGLLAAFVVIVTIFTLRGVAANDALGGFFTGLFIGFIVVIAGASLLAWAITPPGPPPPTPDIHSALAVQLSQTLEALERVRLTVRRRVRRRAAVLIPIGAGLGAAACWGLHALYADRITWVDLALMAGYGGFFGLLAARLPLAGAYGRLYKAEVLPKLAANFGDLHYRRPIPSDLGRLGSMRLFRAFREVQALDELYGDYRGLSLSLRQMRLRGRRGKDRDEFYSGLLVEVALASDRPGETLVIDDAGPFGNLVDELTAGRLQRVGLEDPVFERGYQVYGSDQVMSRVLLTPDVMERLQALRSNDATPRPVLYARDSVLWLLAPRLGRYRLFDPPGYLQPAASTEILLGLHHDIAAALEVVDSVIDLDAATARSAERRRR